MDAINSFRLSEEGGDLLNKQYHDCLSISKLEKEIEATADPRDYLEKVYCPTRFDGWLCWNKTLAGTVVQQSCPYFVEGFTTKNLAYRVCQPNGSWFRHPESNKEWSNYSTCVDLEDMHFREIVNDLYLIGYTISLLALLISLCIFFGFRSLRCTRIRIHVQLFTSLIINCFLWITWYRFVVDVPDVIRNNPRWCVILHLLIHYFMLANYMWMFCEGLHLHLVLVVVFVKDNIALRWFYLIGWGIPMVVMILYGYIRAQFADESRQCWMHESQLNWILTIPVIISLFASLMFLINVIRVLLTKLHPCSGNPAPIGMRKAARAMFILVPLFGLQNVVLPLRPDPGSFIEPYYQVTAAVLISLQGLCVSVLFCFVNHDVLFAVKCYVCKKFPDLFSQVTRDTSNVHITPSRDAILREQIMYDTRLSCTTT